jgi:KGK domain
MTDRSKQIIPDSEAVARCLDPELLKFLDAHSTFTISELLEKIKQPITSTVFREKTDAIFVKVRSNSDYSRVDCFNDFKAAILPQGTNQTEIVNLLVDGMPWHLLQPDGKGWQKGKLKICFEFISEETEIVVAQDRSLEDRSSPLDEIRNSLVETN